MSDIQNEGSITFWAKHDHSDWATNSHNYKWGPITHQGISAIAKKESNAAIEVSIDGPFGDSFCFRRQMPPCGPQGLFVAITWKDGLVSLYLNGELRESKHSASAP